MRTMNFASLITAALLCASCVSGTVTEPAACDSADLGTIPASPLAGEQAPPLSFSTNFDFSSTIDKLGDVSDALQASVGNMAMHSASNMDWLQKVTVTVSSRDIAAPAQLAHYVAPEEGAANPVIFAIDMDTTMLLAYLKSPITLTFTVQGTGPRTPIVLDDTLCVSITGKATKSL